MYDGLPFKTEDSEGFQDQAGKLVVPILRVREEFSKATTTAAARSSRYNVIRSTLSPYTSHRA